MSSSTSIQELINSSDGELNDDAIEKIAADIPSALLIDEFYILPITTIAEIISKTTHVFTPEDGQTFISNLIEARGGLSFFEVSYIKLTLISKLTLSMMQFFGNLDSLFGIEEEEKDKDIFVQGLKQGIEDNDIEMVFEVIDAENSLVNAKFSSGKSAIQMAASLGSNEIVYLLAKLGADVNSRDKRGRTPLHDAAKKGHILTVQILLHRGAKIDMQDNAGCTALHLAAAKGHADVCKFLMDHAADPQIRSNDGLLPEDYAANAACIAALEPNHFCEIFSAIQRNDESAILRLVEMYPNLSRACNSLDTTPMNIVGRMGNAKILNIFIEHGTDIDSVDSDGWTALHEACDYGRLETVKFLVEKGADINKQDDEGRTPLFWASLRGHYDIVEFLLENGADRSIPNKKNEKPKQVAKNLGTFILLSTLKTLDI